MDTWEWEGGGRRRGHLAKRKAVVPSTKRTGPYPGVIPYWYTVHAPEGLSRGKKTGINSGDKKTSHSHPETRGGRSTNQGRDHKPSCCRVGRGDRDGRVPMGTCTWR